MTRVLEQVLGAAPGALVALAPDGTVLAASQDFLALRSQGTGDLTPRPGLARPVTRESLTEAAREVVASGQPVSFEMGEMGPAGAESWYQVEGAPVKDAGGQLVAAVVVATDVTGRKIAEDRLRRSEAMLVDAQGIAQLGTWDWDLSQPGATWSDELYRIYGVTPEQYSPTYEGYLLKVHPDDRERVRQATTRVFEERVLIDHDERILRPDGSVRHLHSWGYPVLDPAGKLVRLIGVCQDITERKLAEEHSARLYAEAREAVRLRDDFLSIASHELRTPLTPLALGLEMLQHQLHGVLSSGDASGTGAVELASVPRIHDLLKLIDSSHQQVRRLSRLVDDLLDVSRISSGRLTLERETVDLNQLIRDVVGRFAEELQRAGCQLVLDLHSPTPIGTWDRLRIEQIVVNLLTNAIKYGAGKPVVVRSQLSTEAVALEIEDRGIGIAAEDQVRIFDRFERAVSAKRFGGLGLGLYIARQIAELHGGTIRVESQLGVGARFSVALPLHSPEGPPG